ncbi:NCS1 family nucleobase:cation symporter-1 [Saccharolobus solfataricus]|uniref:Allantoin permease n=1 Tax=Saccharolobus solfataricus TaxID=2287 RepID=A0A157T2D8_SACSO|nr:NCS1 family nucleobase:cation symporter-1 [Saccharolobus solfataricus]AZF84931.1 allantoin permease [Saccharolobus solfataricus]QPG49151.1 NCS1 family nucleobase:cation symporter-1 [Saccharolobus solfataricus]SAI85577.1 allantoin permease [Saccharolobus solfataricus]
MSDQEINHVNLDLTEYNQGRAVVPDNYYNPNIAPLSKNSKTWTWVNYTTIWAGMIHNVPAFMLAGLLTFEFGPLIALTVIAIAYFTLLIALYLNGHIGVKWGVPFPSSIRPMFGIRGARIPVIMRAISALFWFSVETYAGGLILDALISIFYPLWSTFSVNLLGMPLHMALSFFLFWLLNVLVLFKGMDEIKKFELIAGPLVIIILGGLMIHVATLANGLSPLFQIKASNVSLPNIALGISTMAGFWATLVLNIPDFTRFSRSQKDQLIGQAIGLPILTLLFSFIAVGLTSAVIYIYNIPSSEAINYVNPVNIMFLFTNNPYITLVLGISLVIATISVNVAANIVSPVYDLISLFPKRLNTWSKSAIVSAILGLLYSPWLWYNNASSIENVINLIGAGLGSVAGVMIAHYWILEKTEIKLAELFKPNGRYWYVSGYNINALIAMVIGFSVPVIGFLVPQLALLYDYGWYLGLFLSLMIYLGLEKKRIT